MIAIRKLIQKLNLIVTCFAAALMAAMAYGDWRLPNVVTTCSDKVNFGFLYSVKNEEEARTVPAAAGQEQKEATIRLFDTFPVKTVAMNKTERRYVALGGELIGITLQTEGVLIVGLESFSSGGINVSPGNDAGLKTGDAITAVNGERINDNLSFTDRIENSNGTELDVEYIRNGCREKTVMKPQLSDLTEKYKCGLWIRDCTNGIGTLTYTDIANGTIASLGHAIYDVDTNGILSASGGEFRSASLIGVTKGESGAPGELKGVLGDTTLGSLSSNCDGGVYGALQRAPEQTDLIPVAMTDEIEIGPAQIVATVREGEKAYYDIEIEKISRSGTDGTKNMVVKVCDPELIELTGGIVQGMSGSPIIQNGMFVGAVTHVFLNDPKKGYGIFAENMLDRSDSVCKNMAA